MEKKKEIICNSCGKQYGNVDKVIKHDFLSVKKQWGYFSKKDGRIEEFLICEECYDKWVEGFAIPPTKKTATEYV